MPVDSLPPTVESWLILLPVLAVVVETLLPVYMSLVTSFCKPRCLVYLGVGLAVWIHLVGQASLQADDGRPPQTGPLETEASSTSMANPEGPGREIHQVMLTAEGTSIPECAQQLQRELQLQADMWVIRYLARKGWSDKLDLLVALDDIRHVELETVALEKLPEGGFRQQATATFNDRFRRHIDQRIRQHLSQRRLTQAAAGSLGVLLFIGTVFGYLQFTQRGRSGRDLPARI